MYVALVGCALGLVVPWLPLAANPSPRSPRPVATEDSAAAAQELLQRIEQQRAEGKTDSEILADVQLNAMASQQVAAHGGDASAPAPPTPQRGTEQWGRWSQSDDFITLEYYLADGVRPRDVVCEVAEGWLCVGVDESFGACYDDGVWGGEEVVNEADGKPPLLFGRFAQVCDAEPHPARASWICLPSS